MITLHERTKVNYVYNEKKLGEMRGEEERKRFAEEKVSKRIFTKAKKKKPEQKKTEFNVVKAMNEQS